MQRKRLLSFCHFKISITHFFSSFTTLETLSWLALKGLKRQETFALIKFYLQYTNLNLKISLFVRVHIKTLLKIPFLNLKNCRRIFGQSCQGRYIFVLNLELKEALFYVKSSPSLISKDFNYQYQEKRCHLFATLKYPVPLFDQFHYFRNILLVGA